MYVHEVRWNPDPRERSPVRVNPVLVHADERRLSLDGEWQFRLDPDHRGRARRWFADPRALRDVIRVPGCWQGQGFGHDGADTPWDFRLSARVFRATYEGTAWYGKTFDVSREWRNSRIWLNFGGVHPAAEVWLNGARLGAHCGPFVPFALDATRRIRFGAANFLAVRVHEQNRWLGLAYNWAGHWSGLYRGVEVTSTGGSWIERLWIHPDVDGERLECRAQIGGSAAGPLSLTLSAGPLDRAGITLQGGNRLAHPWEPGPPSDPDRRGTRLPQRQYPPIKVTLDRAPVAATSRRVTDVGTHRITFAIPSPNLWSPDAPNLYRVDAVLRRGDAVQDALTERVGFVKLSTRSKHFLINDEPYYMRGSGDFLAHPETGSPDTDRERWRRKLASLHDYGYNYVRCQSYVPAPEYFDAADEVGLLVQSEMGMLGAWAGMDPWHGYAWPSPKPPFREPLKWQWDRTVIRDVNHPSASIYCMSNELGRGTPFAQTAWQCARDTKAIRPSAFVIWTDGGLNASLPGDFVNAEANQDDQTSLPLIQHEFRWWSSYPDVRTERKFRGAVRPYAIKTAEQAARHHGLHHLLPEMADVSQRLQYVEARGKMEACRRDHPRLAGICHFNAMDIGYSPQGILDEFYERKLVSAETWLRTNGDTVIMIDRDFDDRVLVSGSAFRCALSISDFSHPPLTRPRLEWQLLAGRKRMASGALSHRHRPFCTCAAGRIRVELPRVAKPDMLTLQAVLREGRRTFRSQWNFWLFPSDRGARRPNSAAICGGTGRTWMRTIRSIPRLTARTAQESLPKVVLSERLGERLVEHCRSGGRVILAPPESVLRPFPGKLGQNGAYFFLPPANYPPLEDGHSGTIIRDHPMLGSLPHEGFADLQFFRVISSAPPIDLEALGLGKLEPVIRALSTYFVAVPLAYLMEACIGRGGIILCALNLDQKLPEARYLLDAIVRYAASESFRPQTKPSKQALARLIGEE